MSKKDNLRKIARQSTGENEEVIRMIKVLVGVVLALAAFYFLFAIYSGEISFGKKEEKEPVEIQNVEILAGTVFNRIESEYYVMFYDFDGSYSYSCSAIYNLYSQKSGKMYLVDLGNNLNKDYIADSKDAVNTDNISSLRVMDPTIIKIKDGKAIEVVSGIDDVNSYGKDLIK